MSATTPTKRELRTRLRAVRRAVDDPEGRSRSIWDEVESLDEVLGATMVMVFRSVPGEPSTAAFVTWCRDRGTTVVFPEDDPDPSSIDVVVVPGIAFTRDGHRLGQGGGWYDRFLPRVRPDCLTVGVAFREQVVDRLPIEPHDVTVARVVVA